MADYNKSGVSSDGSIDPLRKEVAGLMHLFSGGGGSLRQMGDDLYKTMKTGEGVGGWTVSEADGAPDGEDKKKKPPGFNDIDYKLKDKSALHRVKPTQMNSGGLVRGAGKAERGRGRGKMV